MGLKQEEPSLSKKEYVQLIEREAELEAVNKLEFRVMAGKSLLPPELHGKWNSFVTRKTYSTIEKGTLLDETIIIMGMIKSGVSTEIIKETLSKVNGHLTVIHFLSEFYPTEVIDAIKDNKDIQIEAKGEENDR